VAPDLAAFADYWSEATGAVVYDGSVDGLAEALTALAGDERRLDRLAGAPLPAYRDPLAPYGGPLPPSRHPRAQSGLATAAGQRVLAVAPEAAPGLPRRLVSRGLRVVPRPAVDWVSRRLPGSLRRRLGGVSDWGGELERRRRLERTSAFELRLLDISDVDDPDVTVVIPVYNQGEFVMDAIMSVFEQTYESWEIVVVDDGSSDAVTVAMLDDLDLPRVRMVRQDNRGLSGARNTGMQLARGRYLVPLDADDEITPRFLERMVVLLEDHPGAAFAHCWAELFGDVHTLWVTRPFNPYVQLMSNSVVGCVLMRREAFEEVGGYDETMLAGNEDWELWVRLQEAGWGQVKLEEPLFRYRKHGVSMSVETEARFEEARIELARRHPRVYRREALARVKARHYPWVTVLAGPNADIARLARQTIVDAEVIVFGPDPPSTEALADRPWRVSMAEDLADAVAKSRGKFLIDWAAVIDAGPGAVEGLAEALEAEPGATAAAVEGVPRRILWRRWTVVDPDSGHVGRAEADVALRSVPCRLGEGLFPQAGWHEPDLSGAVLRQPPEIEGELPEWLETVE
jgi:glycosyltransferase involved in cell wall biosynthesis